MKKKVFLLIVCAAVQHSLTAQIPNSGFETWIGDSPAGWGTMNQTTASSGVFTASKGTPGNPGAFYLNLASGTVPGKGVVHGVAVSGEIDTLTRLPKTGFAYSQRPQSLTGYYQYMIFGGDFGFIHAYLTRWSVATNRRDTIGLAQRTLSGMVMNWGYFDISFNYNSVLNPDTAMIILSASGDKAANADYLYVDNLAFSGGTTSAGNMNAVPLEVKVFPVHTGEKWALKIQSVPLKEMFQLDMMDSRGQRVLRQSMKPHTGETVVSINNELTAGVYFIRLYIGTETITKKIIIQ